MDWTWMRHPATRGRQRFAAPAVPAWRDMGWVPCDPPAEPNLALDPHHPAALGRRRVEATTLADENPVHLSVNEPATEPDKTSKIRRRSSASTEEE